MFGHERASRLVHLKSRTQAGAIILTWDGRGGRAMRWRVLRSSQEFAEGPFDDTIAGSGQLLISDKQGPGSRDDAPERGDLGFYTVFAESERGEWRREAKVKLSAGDPGLSSRPGDDFETGATPSVDNQPLRALESVDFRLDTLKSRAQREHPSVRTDDVD